MYSMTVLKKVFTWVAILFGCLFLVYLIWVLIAYQRTATITVDYVAKVNEVAASVPEQHRGWPLYRKAGIALNADPEPATRYFFEHEIETPQWPTDEGWEYYQSWIDRHQDTLQTIVSAASKQGEGFIISGKTAEEDKELWPEQFASEQLEPPHDGMLVSVLLPQLGHHRGMSRLLIFDAKVAAHEGEAERCKTDLMAVFKMARHVQEHPLLISDLVSHALINAALSTLSEILSYEPFLFSSDTLAEFSSLLQNLDSTLEVRFEGERYFILDLLQRMYTDDGNGDGSIVPSDGAEQLQALTRPSTVLANGFLPAAVAPLQDIFQASRKELIDEYDRRLAQIDAFKGMQLYELNKNEFPPARFGPEHYNPITGRYFLLDLLMPALSNTVVLSRYTRGHVDGILAIIYAIEQFRSTGVWPTSLADAGLNDEWSGEPLRITGGATHPVIYSIGADLDDDGGNHHREAKNWNSTVDGDWVIWPPKE